MAGTPAREITDASQGGGPVASVLDEIVAGVREDVVNNAAAMEGRRAIGAECDPQTYAKAVRRLSAGWTPQFAAVVGA